METQFCVEPTLVSSTQVAPESADVQIFPATAASFVPSDVEVMDVQFFIDPGDVVFSYQVAPELADIQILPL